MHSAAGSKRSRPQMDEREENDATVTSDATGGDGERAAQRLRLEGVTRAAQPTVARGLIAQPAVARGSIAQSAAAAGASASSSHADLTSASRSTTRDESLSLDAGDAAPAVDQLVDQTDQAESQAAATVVSRPLISPARRCDPDSLSLMLSFLGTADFIAAVRVCRQWNSARMKHSAHLQQEP